MPWFVTAFGALCAILGLCLTFVFGSGVKQALAFEVNGVYYPDSLAGVTVTFNRSIYEPTYGTGFQADTWYSLHLTCSNAADGNASSYVYFEGPAASGNHWWFYTSNTQSLQSAGTNGQRYAYDERGPNNYGGWWGTTPINTRTPPTVTFYDVAGDTLLTNRLFIMWVVGNSDYDQRYGNEYWGGGSASASNGVIAFSYTSSSISPLVRIYVSQDQEIWTIAQSFNLGDGNPVTGTYTVSTAGYYKVDFVYTLHGNTQTSTSMVGYVAPPNVNLPIFVECIQTALTGGDVLLTINYSTSGAKPDSVTLYLSTDGGQSYRQVAFQNRITEDGGHYNCYFTVEEAGEYSIIAQVTGGQTETYLGQITPGEASGDSQWESIWDNAWSTLQRLFATFTSIFSTLFFWIPSELRGFILAFIAVLLGLGLISRVI